MELVACMQKLRAWCKHADLLYASLDMMQCCVHIYRAVLLHLYAFKEEQALCILYCTATCCMVAYGPHNGILAQFACQMADRVHDMACQKASQQTETNKQNYC